MVDVGDVVDAIKGLFNTAGLALVIVFALPIALVMMSLATSSWIPIVVGLGISIYIAATLIKKNQRRPPIGDDNKVFNPELQEKAIQYLQAAKEQDKEEDQS